MVALERVGLDAKALQHRCRSRVASNSASR
jgi:hypothetical protein